jgi:hypothetical protein
MADEDLPSREKGAIFLALLAHAVIYLLLTAAQAIWVAVTASRIWQRRDAGLSAAVKDGVHRPTLAGISAATLLCEITRRAGVAMLSHRVAGHEHRTST